MTSSAIPRRGYGASRYVCPTCGVAEERIGTFVEVPEETRDYRGQEERLPEVCSTCAIEMTWMPQSASHDLLGEFFTIDLDGQQTKFSSLHELRAFEQRSLRRAANGEGAAHIFRGFSQDRSNRDVNTLRGSSLETGRQIPFDRRTHAGAITGRPVSEHEARKRHG